MFFLNKMIIFFFCVIDLTLLTVKVKTVTVSPFELLFCFFFSTAYVFVSWNSVIDTTLIMLLLGLIWLQGIQLLKWTG